MIVQLSCVGCGRDVFQVESGKRTLLAISCICGAGAPILRGDDGSFAPPYSLVSIVQRSTDPSVPWRLKRGASPPHLEYYLGYSDHESVVKTALSQYLCDLGSISQADCPEEGCQGDYQRGRERWQRREERDLAEREREYRMLEIGEP